MPQTRSRSRRIQAQALLILLALVLAACGADQPADGVADGEAASADSADPPEGDAITEDTAPAPITVSEVELPPGIALFDAPNQWAKLSDVTFLVTGQADGIRLVAIRADGVWQTDAVIEGASFGEVWDSGSRVVLTGLNPDGELIVLSSTDGETFTEIAIPVPARYVDAADVWDPAAPMSDVGGVVDYGDDLYVIAHMGVKWQEPFEMARTYAVANSEELRDSVYTFVGSSVGDDTLWSFKDSDGNTILEVLGSEAGIEPGYEEAFWAFYEGIDVGYHGAWIISEGTVFEDPLPMDGGLDGDLRLQYLYPIENGVAAFVTDFGADAEGQVKTGGRLSVGSLAQAGTTKKTRVTFFGEDGIFQWGDTVTGEDLVVEYVDFDSERGNGVAVARATDDGEVLILTTSDGKEWDGTIRPLDPEPDLTDLVVELTTNTDMDGRFLTTSGYDATGKLLHIGIYRNGPVIVLDEFGEEIELELLEKMRRWRDEGLEIHERQQEEIRENFPEGLPIVTDFFGEGLQVHVLSNGTLHTNFPTD